ncbi:hypothetical protein N0V94_007618 [Neodidymelliopsis sp. IMI 364377]|nr:hypothetical protein N0V94_007618 [Neodidymelliopsis sp. IMI 364377]
MSAVVGRRDSASPVRTHSQPTLATMNNNFNPWAHPFMPTHGYPAQPHDEDRDRNRNQWQTPAQGYAQPASVASAPWNANHAQLQQHYPGAQQAYNMFAAQQAQAQAYYYQWAQYYGQTQGFTPINSPPQPFGQQPQQPSPFFAPSHAAMQSHPHLQGVSNGDLQYAFDKLYKGIKARTRMTNVSRRASTPHSDDEPIQANAHRLANAKEYGSLRRVDSSSRINKCYREPTVYPTTKPTGRSKEPKIMLPPPAPTEAYMAQAAGQPSKVDLSGRILVILDLNGTLLFRPNRNKKTMIARPFLIPFLRYLFANFAVMVWSSARPDNVTSLVEQSLEENLRKALVAQWARDAFGLKPEHYNRNVQVYKHLDLVWKNNAIQKQHPDYTNGGRFGQHNTVLIDDSLLKANAQPYNLLQISEFSATSEQMRKDDLREVAGYLEVLRTQQDVSKFINKGPFRHGTGKWVYEWPEKDAATQGTAWKGGELHSKVSMEGGSKKKNKKAKKREEAEIAAQRAKLGGAGEAVASDRTPEVSEVIEKVEKSDLGEKTE